MVVKGQPVGTFQAQLFAFKLEQVPKPVGGQPTALRKARQAADICRAVHFGLRAGRIERQHAPAARC